MMFENVTIEISGIKRVVVDTEKVYARNDDNSWINMQNGKHIPDHLMIIRIKQMLRKPLVVYGDRVEPVFNDNTIRYKENIVIGYVHKYRAWVHGETLNIEKVIV